MTKLSQLILEQKIDVVKDDWSKGLENPVVTLSNGKSYELELVNQEFEDGYYMYFFETPDLPGYEFVTIGNEDDPTSIDGWEVNVYSSKLPKEIPGFEGTRDALDNLSIRESKDFNLKKFLVENKLTSNSKKLYENREKVKVTKTVWSRENGDPVDDPYEGKGEYIPTVTINGKEYTLTFDDDEPGDDPGTVLMTYFTDELPGYEFTTIGANYGPHYVLDPRYYFDDWDIYKPKSSRF